MRLYNTISIISALAFVAGSLFFFLRDEDELGALFVLLTFIMFFSIYYLFKSMYYLRYQATLNDTSFVILFPLVPPFILWLKEVLGVEGQEIQILQSTSGIEGITINIFDIVLLPFYIMTIFFLLRSHLRYPFIRLTGTSESGISARLVAFLLTFVLPLLYWIIGLITLNFPIMIFSFFILIVGILGLFI